MADEMKKSGTRDDLVQSGTRPRDGNVDYRIIFDASSNGMAFTEVDSGRIVDVNAAWLSATGFFREEAIGKTALELGLWPDPARRATCYAELQKKGLLADFEVSLVFKSVEIPHLVSARFFEMDDKRYVLWEFRNIAGQKQSEAKIAALLAKSEQSRRSLLSMLQDMKQAEETLKESEEKYRNLVERANDGICILQDVILQYVNPQLSHMAGYSPEEVTGLPFSDFIMPEEIPKVLDRYKRRMAGEDVPPIYESALRHKDGSRIDVEFNAGPIIYKEKPADLVLVRDITERKRIAEALKETEARFRTLFEAIPDTVLVHDLEGTILHINEIGAQKLEWSAKDLKGRNLREIVTPDNAVSIADHVRETQKTGWSVFETIYLARSGWQHMSEVHEHPIKFGAKKAILSVARDITDRKKAEKKLQESEERFRLAFENANIGVCLVDLEGNLTRVNAKMCEIFGYTKKELEHKTVNAIAHPEDINTSPTFMKNALEGKTVSGAFEKRYIHKKGHVLTCEVTSSLVYGAEGSPLYFISHVRDITKRKQVERELEEEREREKRYLDIAGVIILVTDTKGVVTLINRKGCEILGYAQEEIIGKRWIDNFIPPRIRDDVNVIEHMMMAGQIEAAEYHENYLMTKSGAERVISWHNTLLRDERGVITGILTSGADITERRQAEEQLENERNKFSILAENAPFGMLMIDNDGNFIYLNQKFKELFGYNLSDIPDGKTWFRKAYPDREYRHMVISAWVDDLKQAKAGEKRQEQYTVRCKDGTEKIINFIPVQLETGLQIMSFEDITERRQTEDEVKHGFEQLRETFISTVNALAATVEMKDQYTAGHQPRTTQLACAIAEEMGLPEAQIEGLRMAASLHDIGKIVVPAEILNKPGPLTEIQFEMIRMHPQAGYDILKAIKFPWPVAQIVLQHHELMNGSGYPQGLRGDEIMLEARILMVANVVEAMTAHRPYRPAYDITEAFAEISKNRGILYDPAAVDACLRLFAEKRFTFN